MKSKLRNAIIISILCLMALCSVIALVAVFAANNQTINSKVSVSFKAPGIRGKVSANYYIGAQDKTGTPMTTDGTSNGAKELIFNPSETSANGALNPQGDIELTFENNFVVFEYIFQNGLGDPVTDDFVAELSLNTTTTNNIKMTTKQSKEKITNFSRIVLDVDSSSGNDKGWMVVDHNEEGDYISTKYFYVKAEVENTSIDASFSGNFNWELNLAEPSLDNLAFELIDNDHYAVSSGGVKDDETNINIIIPKTYIGEDGVERLVTEISVSGFQAYRSISFNNIYIPDSITKIGNGAFGGSNAIKGEIIIPDSVTDIGMQAFENNPLLTSIVIGSNVASIGQNPFRRCENLTDITIDSRTLCENFLTWDLSTLTVYATTIRAKYEIIDLNYSSKVYERSESKDSDGYWVYTSNM